MAELVGLFFSAMISASILPGTSEAVLIYLISTGTTGIPLLVAIATLGNVTGSIINWILGLYVERFGDRKWFPVSPEKLDKAQRWFSRYGVYALLFSWVPLFGDALTLFAGVMRTKLLPFIILVAIGKGARYVVIAYTASAIAR
ncbi:YqaA family protein [Rhizobium sp. EC-SD404]|uniref:YqaA family protein n=1 Tax=Rhizobium sp. EC-SD404 TaxID=2038389 RepID=UPI001251DBB6|nr:YqaA family protein [Rhizobium sp. EC-SD404]VVT14593.1 Inner membrane protein YqaA [Rhizobium sp. EC-SD404]